MIKRHHLKAMILALATSGTLCSFAMAEDTPQTNQTVTEPPALVPASAQHSGDTAEQSVGDDHQTVIVANASDQLPANSFVALASNGDPCDGVQVNLGGCDDFCKPGGCSASCGFGCGCAKAGKPVVTVYGFGQVDYIQDFNRVAPAWESTLRPSRVPTQAGQYGSDGSALLSVRQSRLGASAVVPTTGGDLNAKVEFDFFGVGADEGQTTVRLRHAFGSYNNWLGGQTHSLFMDINVFPNVIDYWGPAGMVFLRTPQIRWTPIQGDHSLAFSLETPDSGIDTGVFSREIQDLGADVQSVERFPDFGWRYRYTQEGAGHFQVAGLIRPLGYDTVADPPPAGNRPKENLVGWGVNLSGNLYTVGKNRLIGQYVVGHGIAGYMNDGGVDIAPRNGVVPADPAPQPLQGIVLYYDHYWNKCYSSSIGWSMTEVQTFRGQADDAFRRGRYVSANLLYSPIPNFLTGIEYLWGDRKDHDGAIGEDNRMQISFKYSF